MDLLSNCTHDCSCELWRRSCNSKYNPPIITVNNDDCSQVDWRQKLDTQRGAVLANELKNNACKLAKWTVQSILAGADNLKFGYVTRYNVKDSSRHVILGTQQFKPIEFGQQINLNMDNARGVVRCILDLIMAQKVRYPGQYSLYLYFNCLRTGNT